MANIFTCSCQSQTFESFECVKHVFRFWRPSFDDRLDPAGMSSGTKASAHKKKMISNKNV